HPPALATLHLSGIFARRRPVGRGAGRRRGRNWGSFCARLDRQIGRGDTLVRLISALDPILEVVAFERQQMRDFKGKVCATTGRHRWRVVDRLADFEFVTRHKRPPWCERAANEHTTKASIPLYWLHARQ